MKVALLVALLFPTTLFAGGTVIAKRAALSTAHPLATKAGLSVLQRGGTAADAAVAVAFALAVVHPQAGNLGGGGFLLYYDASTRAVWTLDFRETAPHDAKRDMFAKVPAKGALAAGTPGTVAGLAALHAKFGKRAWKELLAPAIALAHDGPRADPEIAADIATEKSERGIEVTPSLPAPELATTLQRLADHGARDFYDGEIAKRIVDSTHAAGGILGYRDLHEYQPIWRAPIKLHYGPYEIVTVAPPSGGGLVIGEVLNILAGDDLASKGFQTPQSLHLLAEAERRAYIDRNRYIADPITARIPYRDLLSQKRAAAWRKTIDPAHVVATNMLAEPSELRPEGAHTTHFTIVDGGGNIVALTTTLGDNFGSGVMLSGLGFFLNDALTDFTPNAGPNQLDPLKRAASSLTPIIVLRNGKPFLAMGTRGGAAIPTTLLQVFLNVVVYGKPLADAIAAPRWHHQAIPDRLEYESRAPQKTVDALNAMGHAVVARNAIGDVHAILIENGRLTAVADPRRGGAAGGM
ncbi:MAG TPA: gamma-glutamyltransferase [Thermoanaerobaculia bacterium]|nr:gamma-glutamyltransferase [Thermoanaerobaculia bacterium]